MSHSKPVSKARLAARLSENLNKAFNEELNREIELMIFYHKGAAYAGRTDVSLPGFFLTFLRLAAVHHYHAMSVFNYILTRSGRVRIGPPPSLSATSTDSKQQKIQDDDDFDGISQVVDRALEMECETYKSMIELAKRCRDEGDEDSIHFVRAELTESQVEIIQNHERLSTKLSMLCSSEPGRTAASATQSQQRKDENDECDPAGLLVLDGMLKHAMEKGPHEHSFPGHRMLHREALESKELSTMPGMMGMMGIGDLMRMMRM